MSLLDNKNNAISMKVPRFMQNRLLKNVCSVSKLVRSTCPAYTSGSKLYVNSNIQKMKTALIFVKKCKQAWGCLFQKCK